MQKLPPFDKIGVTPVPDFVNAAPQSGIPGSIVNGQIFNAVQDEIQNAELAAGLTPTDADHTQLTQALALGGLFVDTFGGSADALTATIPGGVTIPAVKAGMRVTGFIGTTNATTSPNLAVAGFTTGSAAAPIKRRGGSAPAIGDLVVGTLVTFRFDGTNWRIDGVVGSDVAAAGQGTFVPTPTTASNAEFTLAAMQSTSGTGINDLLQVAGPNPGFGTMASNGLFTLSEAGIYSITAFGTLHANAAGYIALNIGINNNVNISTGSGFGGAQGSSGTWKEATSCSTGQYMNIGDQVGMYAQTSPAGFVEAGATLTILKVA